MDVTCPRCSLVASVTITGRNRHTLTISGPGTDCVVVQEQLALKGTTEMFPQCPHLDRAAEAVLEKLRR